MKRFLLIAGAAALLMTSCSEEKFLNDSGLQQANTDGNSAITFQGTKPNQSRAPLEEYATNFGIFGIKADNKSDISVLPKHEDKLLVFDNYLVGYYQSYPLKDKNDGLGETGGIGGNQGTNFTSNWYYEGLGYNEYDYPADFTNPKSGKDNQYLKYWDASKTFTYFVAYTPYEPEDPTKTVEAERYANVPEFIYGKDDNHILQLKCKHDISIDDAKPFMVAAKQELNSDHIGKSEPVSLQFSRCQSQIRIAFYEAIKGYSVTMINVHSTKKDAKGNLYGIAAMPYSKTATGHIGAIKKRMISPIIDIKNPGTTGTEHLKCEFNSANEESGFYNFNFSLPTGELPEKRADMKFSDRVYNVFPVVEGAATDDLQFVMSFTLKADDTGEEITVRNARVNVPDDYTKWKDNCLYTYIFKITKNTNGTTSTPAFDPTVPEEPSDDPALYPIVFDNLTVAEMDPDGHTTEYTLYDSNHNPTANDDANGVFIFRSDIKKDFEEVNVGSTLNLASSAYMTLDYLTLHDVDATKANFTFESGDTYVATVDQRTGVVTGKHPGWTTIYVYYKKGAVDEVRDALILYVTMDNQMLLNAKWNFGVNTPASLESLLNTAYSAKLSDIKWYIYDTNETNDRKELGAENITTSEYTYDATTDPTNKTITFKKEGKIYFCTAVYKEGDEDNEHSDYFFIVVKNVFLALEKQDCVTGIAYNLNDFLKSSTDATKITWKIRDTEFDSFNALTADDTYYTYNTSTKELTFKAAAEGKKFVLEATNAATSPSSVEYLTLSVKAAPTPSTPGE